MKWLFKWALRLVLLVVALVVVLLLSKDTIFRIVIENRIRSRTGLDVKIGKYSSSIFSPVITIENLRIYNTAEFGGTPFLDVPEIHLELDAAAFARREVHFTLARVHLAEFDVVRNQAGLTNLYSIVEKVRREKKAHKEKLFGDFKFTGVDTLNVTIGKSRYIDLQDTRNNCEAAIDLRDQVFSNLSSEDNLTAAMILLSGRVMYNRREGDACAAPLEIFERYSISSLTKRIFKEPKSPRTNKPAPLPTNQPAK